MTDSRVLIITDRTELDEQIEKAFKGVSEHIHRTKSGADLVNVLNANEEWLGGSLIHKFAMLSPPIDPSGAQTARSG